MMEPQKNESLVRITESPFQKAEREFNEAKDKVLKLSNELIDKGELYALSQEEIELLHMFRKFKIEIKKPSMFRIMTLPKDPIPDESVYESDRITARKI